MLLALPISVVAQTVYGIRLVPASGNVGIYSVDPATGIPFFIVDTGVPNYFIAETAFDPTGRRYFLVSRSGELFTVNVTSGGFTHVAGSMSELQYDPLTGNLYGIRFVPGSGSVGIYTMNPSTGIPALIADTGVPNFISGTAFDPVGRRYFFVSGRGDLFTVNVTSGGFTHVAAGYVPELQYDPLTGNLYGIQFALDSGNVGIYVMNPSNGVPALIADTGVRSYTISGTAFDPVGRRYFLVSGDGELFTVNVTSGTFLHVASDIAEIQYAPTSVQTIPLLDNVTIMLLAITLLAAGLLRLPR